MKKYWFLFSTCLLSASLYAQQGNLSNSTTPIQYEEPPLDGYVQSTVGDREIMPYSVIRSTDAVIQKRIWREFDVREKMNSLYASPKASLIKVIMDAVLAGELTAYDPTPTEDDPTGDSFKTRLPADQVLGKFGADSVLVPVYDENGDMVDSYMAAGQFNPEDVVRYRIKEDWIFDKQRSVFEVRIVGIAPLVTPKIEGLTGASSNPFGGFDDFGSAEATPDDVPDFPEAGPAPQPDATPAFWIYFPEARHVFVKKEVMSRQNDATGLSYDDVFIKRLFASYIVKQSNPEDLRIRDYISDGLERLYEAEKIKQHLINLEQDLWSY